MAFIRVNHWALTLSTYDYNISSITSKDNACTNYLSRALIKASAKNKTFLHEAVLPIEGDNMPETQKVAAQETRKMSVSAWTIDKNLFSFRLACH